MFDKRRVDLLIDGLKNKALIGVKSKIMCQPHLYNDFNATANHLKDVVNRMPELQTAAVVDVVDVVDMDLTAATYVEAVAMTVVDVVNTSQSQPLSAL